MLRLSRLLLILTFLAMVLGAAGCYTVVSRTGSRSPGLIPQDADLSQQGTSGSGPALSDYDGHTTNRFATPDYQYSERLYQGTDPYQPYIVNNHYYNTADIWYDHYYPRHVYYYPRWRHSPGLYLSFTLYRDPWLYRSWDPWYWSGYYYDPWYYGGYYHWDPFYYSWGSGYHYHYPYYAYHRGWYDSYYYYGPRPGGGGGSGGGNGGETGPVQRRADRLDGVPTGTTQAPAQDGTPRVTTTTESGREVTRSAPVVRTPEPPASGRTTTSSPAPQSPPATSTTPGGTRRTPSASPAPAAPSSGAPDSSGRSGRSAPSSSDPDNRSSSAEDVFSDPRLRRVPAETERIIRVHTQQSIINRNQMARSLAATPAQNIDTNIPREHVSRTVPERNVKAPEPVTRRSSAVEGRVPLNVRTQVIRTAPPAPSSSTRGVNTSAESRQPADVVSRQSAPAATRVVAPPASSVNRSVPESHTSSPRTTVIHNSNVSSRSAAPSSGNQSSTPSANPRSSSSSSRSSEDSSNASSSTPATRRGRQ